MNDEAIEQNVGKEIVDIESILNNFQLNHQAKNAAPSIRIVYSKTGSHIALSEALRKNIGNPDKVQFFFDDSRILIGNFKNANQPSYKINDDGKVYCSQIVKEIAKVFNLKYKANTKASERIPANGYSEVSKSFKSITFEEYGTVRVAIVNIKNTNEEKVTK